MARFASEIGLHYVSDEDPGYTKVGGGYRDLRDREITDPKILSRIASLKIPPAYKKVWICPDPKGHIQAVAYDKAGNKQYRYHPKWVQARSSFKFARMSDFGRALPAIREAVKEDLELPGLSRKKVLAMMVALLDKTLIRVGNEIYAIENKTYGLTTLRRRHVTVEGSSIEFNFLGKSGQFHSITLKDRKLASLIKECRAIPGSPIFRFQDEGGTLHPVTSDEVKEYIGDISGDTFTPKDFRTWGGTVLAVKALRELCDPDRERNIREAYERVANGLGNTWDVSRDSYVHPEIISAYLEKEPFEEALRATNRSGKTGLSWDEVAVLNLIDAD